MIRSKESYSSDNYNSLLHIEDAKLIDISETVNLCIGILAKASLAKYFGVARLHKHYELSEKEAVILSATTVNGLPGY